MASVPENAPEACPGPQSQDAGKGTPCQGCPNQSVCASGLPKGPDPAVAQVTQRLSDVKHKLLVLSGKGGVGKTTVSAGLAWALAANEESQVGLMDVDICGPSIPRVMGANEESVHNAGSGWSPVYVADNLAVMSTGFLLNSPDDAIIWRGPKKNGLIKQFLLEVAWGSLDWLVVDTPPGTSDEHLSVVQYLSGAGVDGAVLVSTPQEVSLADVRREIGFCRKVGVPIIGVVENMSVFVCPKCAHPSSLFPPSTGGVEAMCKEYDLPFLGRVPLDPRIGQCCDEGRNFIEDVPDSPVSQTLLSIAKKLQGKHDQDTCMEER